MRTSSGFQTALLALLILFLFKPPALHAQDTSKKTARELLYHTLLGLNHPESKLHVAIRIVRCEVKTVGKGKEWVRNLERAEASAQALILPDDSYFTIEVQNTGEKPAYLSVLDLDAEHASQRMYPHPDGRDVPYLLAAHSDWTPLTFDDGKRTVWRITPPAGLETLLLLATEEPLVLPTELELRASPGSNSRPLAIQGDWMTASVTWRIPGKSDFKRQGAPLDLEGRRSLYLLSGNITRGINTNTFADIVLNNLGDVFRPGSASDPGILILEKQVAAFHAHGDRMGEAEALHRLGLACDAAANYARANACYEQAVLLESTLKDPVGEADVLVDRASIYRALNQQAEAIVCCEKALALRRSLKDAVGETVALNTEGMVYSSISAYEKARGCFEQALHLAQQNEDKVGQAAILSNLGALYGTLSQYPKALDYYAQALALNRALNDLNGEALTLSNQGTAYAALKDEARAERSYLQALDASTRAHNMRESGLIRANLAGVYKSFKKFDLSLENYRQALAVAQTVKNRVGEGAILHDIASVYYAMGNSEKAISYDNLALPIRREVKDRAGEAYTLNNLMFAWKARNSPRLAIYYGKQAVNVYQAIRTDIQGLDKEAQRSFLTPRAGAYRTLADLLISQGRLPEAQQVLNMLKQEEYSDFVRRDPKEDVASVRAPMTPTEAALEKRYSEISDQVTAIGHERGQLMDKNPRTAAEEKRLTGLEADLEVANHAFERFLTTQLPQAFVSPAVAREKVTLLRDAEGLSSTLLDLGPDVVAIYTVVADEKYSIVLFTSQAQIAREYPIKAEDLRLKVARFRTALMDPHLDPLPLAQELYKILVAPIEQDLVNAHAKTILWSLDDVLRYVPVCALYDGRQYLVERYQNVVFTPASNARLGKTPSAHWKGLGLGVSKEEGNFPALPGAAAELNGIISPMGAILPGDVMLNDQFTKSAMETSLRQHYSVVHIASHFQFTPGNENDSFLLLGKGGRLTLSDFKSLPTLNGVELLTLSACNTAVGDATGDGHEVEGFGVLAQRKGAQAVLASLWPVADDSTKTLMQQFYRNREAQAGRTKIQALQLAQLALLKGTLSVPLASPTRSQADNPPANVTGFIRFKRDPQAPYSHPYFWAPFILIGNWR